MNLIRVWDCETTGLPGREAPGEAPHEMVEIGVVDVHLGHSGPRIGGSWSMLLKPTRPIALEAMAVHHLTEADVARGAPQDAGRRALAVGAMDAFCAHNAAFERQFFDGAGLPWIDTWKVALRLWPDMPAHSNQVLRYGLGLDLPPALAMPPHRARPDALVTAHILMHAIAVAGATPEQMIAWSAEGAALPRVPSGRDGGGAAGLAWPDVPAANLDELAEHAADENVRFSARLERDRRRREGGAA